MHDNERMGWFMWMLGRGEHRDDRETHREHRNEHRGDHRHLVGRLCGAQRGERKRTRGCDRMWEGKTKGPRGVTAEETWGAWGTRAGSTGGGAGHDSDEGVQQERE